MGNDLNILYRGPLESCNYDCSYCPFAKKKNTREELAYDKECLNRFEDWVATQDRPISILFTPWGEALIRKYYQQALKRLSWQAGIQKISIQTNLSGSLGWTQAANQEKLALWTTFHPTETTVARFLSQCNLLQQNNIKYSVGIVGKKENFSLITQLKENLPDNIYFWVNAYKREPDYYTKVELDFLWTIDPLFSLNNTVYKTKGKACFAGESSVSIDGEGNVMRCHFIKEKIGNIYQQSLNQILSSQPCSNQVCRCYIGYMNLKELNLKTVYGDRILERIPIEYH